MKTTPERAAQELNTLRQLLKNWPGQMLTAERAEKIARHAAWIVEHVTGEHTPITYG
jgi:hypothetical protein